MNEIKPLLMQDLKTAMTQHLDKERDTLRMIMSSIKNKEIDLKHPAEDDDIIQVLSKMEKQRKESIEAYTQAGRTDLVESERQELLLIERYLPLKMTELETRQEVQKIISQMEDTSNLGLVMKQVMGQLKGKVDGQLANKIVMQLVKSS